MEDGDNTRGVGRGTGRGISRGRGRGRGRVTTTLPQNTIGQPTFPDTSKVTRPPRLHVPSAFNAHVASQPSQSTPSPHSSTQNHVTPPVRRSTPSPCVPSTSHCPMAPEPPTPTPSPHLSTTHVDVASNGSPHVSLPSDVDSFPQIGSIDTVDRRMWIRPGPGLTFDPPIQPTREIIKIIKSKFEGCWESYGEVKRNDKKVAEMWFLEFKRKYKWLPEYEVEIKKIFDHKASDGYSNAMYRVRHKTDLGNWIPNEMREQLEQKWADTFWKEKATVNSNNRRSSDGSLHTGGSIPTTEHYKRLEKSLDKSPSCWELFQRTHKVKGDTKWVSSKSEMIANEYEGRIIERDSQETTIGDDVSSQQSDNNIFLEVVGGVDKKGRVFGLGPEAEKYKPSSKSSIGVSRSEYEQLAAENKSLKEQMEKILATQEQMRQFMMTFSQNHQTLPPHPPTPANEDQDDNVFHDDLD